MTALNTLIASAGTVLIGLGISALNAGDVVTGCVEVALGVVCYAAYELIPPSRS